MDIFTPNRTLDQFYNDLLERKLHYQEQGYGPEQNYNMVIRDLIEPLNIFEKAYYVDKILIRVMPNVETIANSTEYEIGDMIHSINTSGSIKRKKDYLNSTIGHIRRMNVKTHIYNLKYFRDAVYKGNIQLYTLIKNKREYMRAIEEGIYIYILNYKKKTEELFRLLEDIESDNESIIGDL